MITYYSNKSFIAVRGIGSKTSEKKFASVLGRNILFVRIGKFQCAVGDHDIFVGEQFVDEPNLRGVDPAMRIRRLEMLQIVESKLGPRHKLRKKLLAAIQRERDQHSRQRWFAVSPNMKVTLDIPPSATEIEAKKLFVESLGKSRLPRGIRLEKQWAL